MTDIFWYAILTHFGYFSNSVNLGKLNQLPHKTPLYVYVVFDRFYFSWKKNPQLKDPGIERDILQVHRYQSIFVETYRLKMVLEGKSCGEIHGLIFSFVKGDYPIIFVRYI